MSETFAETTDYDVDIAGDDELDGELSEYTSETPSSSIAVKHREGNIAPGAATGRRKWWPCGL